jgi:uncharacterized delta-60 repeat protein
LLQAAVPCRARLKADGSADGTFGTGGAVTISGAVYINAVAVEPNGNVLVAYQNTDTTGNYVIELNANGTVDTSFGSSGIATVAGRSTVFSLFIRADGEILVGGQATDGDMTLTLLTAAGSADTSFGSTAGTTTVTGSGGAGLFPAQILVESDGDVLVALASFAEEYVQVYQFSPAGTLDTSFGSSGKASPGLLDEVSGEVNIMSLEGNGDILVAGISTVTTYEGPFDYVTTDYVAVARLLPDGDADTTFGTSRIASSTNQTSGGSVAGIDVTPGGITTVTLSGWTNWTAITGMVVQSNGNIDLAVQTTSGGMSVAQLNSSGGVVSGFGSSGLATFSTLPAADGIVIAPNGNLLVAGTSSIRLYRRRTQLIRRRAQHGL